MAVKWWEEGTALSNVPKVIIWACDLSVWLHFFRVLNMCPVLQAYYPFKSSKQPHEVCCSVTQSCPALCDPMDCSTLGFPVPHYFLELAQTHVHWVDDAIQPSHPLSHLHLLHSIFLSIRVFSRVGSLNQVATVSGLQLQHQFHEVGLVQFLAGGKRGL